MTLVIPENYAHVLHSFRVSGDTEPYAITYAVEVSDPPVAGSLNLLAGVLHELYNDNLGPQTAAVVTLQRTEIRYQSAAPPVPPGVGTWAVDHVGGNSGATVIAPQQVAFLVHKRTALAGRRGRGRMYLPGVPEGSVDNVGNVLAGTLTGYQAALDAWLADIIADPNFVGMALLHDDGGITATPDPTLVASLQIDPVVATQRRRLRK